jgi:hypothetical protein
MSSVTPKTLKEAETLAAEKGILLSDREREYIAHAQSHERARLQSINPPTEPGLAAKWNLFYPRLLQMIVSIGETLLTLAQTLIVSLGVPVVLFLLLVVEHQRVVHGIALFEKDTGLAAFAAGALVLLNLVLEFQIHHIEHKAGYTEERGLKWSLIILGQKLRYASGWGYDIKKGEVWREQLLSPAQRYKGLLRLVTFSILALALVGSMREIISSQTGTWYAALGSILTTSSLIDMMTWLGGLLFAAAAVLAAQGLSRYVAIRCVEILAGMHTAQIETTDPYATDVDAAGALALLGIINAKEIAKTEKATKAAKLKQAAPLPEQPQEAAPVEQPRPFGNTAPLSAKEDLENTPMIVAQPVSEYAVSANGNGH